ncbi:MAG: 50S ribosomal protein L6 [Acidobacteria bacterium RIFCSPLOWO2_02_FULL_61_28]|nr:MAG: 50S ribosomal protein L6 [Acidobacteria bacterium RIFCSPLOWO2_02_FULL_61_28]
MSRIGKKPIAVPPQVEVNIEDNTVQVKGPKGELQLAIPAGIRVERQDVQLLVLRQDDSLAARHGLVRSLLANNVHGVTQGFLRELEIVGIGYRAEVKGKSAVLFSLGYSHPIEFPIPEGIQISVDRQTRIAVSGIDKQKVGQVAANIRALRPPDPYKNKGIRYAGEVLVKKVGKAGATAK